MVEQRGREGVATLGAVEDQMGDGAASLETQAGVLHASVYHGPGPDAPPRDAIGAAATSGGPRVTSGCGRATARGSVRILYVTQVMLDEPSGASRHVIAGVRELAALGHDLTLIAPGKAEAGRARRVRPPPGLRPGLRMELSLAALATREILLRRPDVAYVRISATTSAVPSAIGALRVPLVLELNGPILDELDRLGRGPGAVETVRQVLRTVVRQARSVVVPLPSVGQHAVHALGAHTVDLVENGADLEEATPGDRDEARRALGLPTEPRMIGAVGNLAPELRFDLLAEAHRRLPGAALLVVGDGAQRPFIDAMAMATRPSSPVLYLGRRPHAEAVLALRASDAVVNVRDGCLGTKSLEYAAVGRRQVAFDTEGSERLLTLFPPELEAVHLVSERSGDALRAALSAALDAEARLGPLPPAAVTEARAALGWDRTARDLITVLERHG
jgi:glycosyltransferase involved in cell wall biosynthesis